MGSRPVAMRQSFHASFRLRVTGIHACEDGPRCLVEGPDWLSGAPYDDPENATGRGRGRLEGAASAQLDTAAYLRRWVSLGIMIDWRSKASSPLQFIITSTRRDTTHNPL